MQCTFLYHTYSLKINFIHGWCEISSNDMLLLIFGFGSNILYHTNEFISRHSPKDRNKPYIIFFENKNLWYSFNFQDALSLLHKIDIAYRSTSFTIFFMLLVMYRVVVSIFRSDNVYKLGEGILIRKS